jgi:hypothetical protein
LACCQRPQKAKRRQGDLVLALEVRVEHRGELGRRGADSPAHSRSFRERLVDFVMFGLQPRFPRGIPTADVTGLSNFCTIDDSPSPAFQFLVRFRSAAGAILATVRVSEVERVFCSQGGAIAFADLTDRSPAFHVVTQPDVEHLNSLVAAMIR